MHLKKSTSSDKVGDRRSNKLSPPLSFSIPFLRKMGKKVQYGIPGLGLESPEAAQVVPSSSTPLFPLRACSYFVLCTTARERVRIPFRSDKLQPQSWKTSPPPSPDLPPAAAAGDGVAFPPPPLPPKAREIPSSAAAPCRSHSVLGVFFLGIHSAFRTLKNPGGKSRDVPKRLSKQLRNTNRSNFCPYTPTVGISPRSTYRKRSESFPKRPLFHLSSSRLSTPPHSLLPRYAYTKPPPALDLLPKRKDGRISFASQIALGGE